MVVIASDHLNVSINPQGAELRSIFSKEYQLEYMWGADPKFWGKTSPVLFPIVGQLKDNTYLFEGREYTLPRHGFAREREFIVEHTAANEATFLLVSDDETKKVYPFDFEFRLHYKVKDHTLTVTYDVHNIGRDPMYFSVGGHPAFKVPLAPGLAYSDYYLEFPHMETTYRMTLENGLIHKPVSFLNYEKHFPLSHELFYGDAIVLKNLKSTRVFLKSDKDKRLINFNFMGFPYLGIWAAKDADFVCIEPWHGIADNVNSDKNFAEKEGIKIIEPAERWQASWQVMCN